ncbi:DsrE family protein [Halodesulfovibrio marinisediminis]|uniref:Intracellular sulfur oxidation protein, DsrE/DsrF family n=1 Tax=Halodesulfovibrio marinisediminis DSM 17456 TaxID=1121457 RepID=A0A1N6GQE3_9BACT|nr:DsrE family protein [Halodesulfovibrio marinisediminis]SIO09724.1 Intracellular sulfur oxidation protein, DsrE/DsrF family [Halodesulfovibrio marinisediminis DSM 17456]
MSDEKISQTDFQKLMLLLSEKRTAHTTLRSGIALSAFSMTIISFIIVMTSKIDGTFNQIIFIALGLGSVVMLILGIYFIRRGFTRMRFHDALINQILYVNHEASSLFYHTRKRNNLDATGASMHYDTVFHFDKGTTELEITISNIENYYESLSGKKFNSYLVINGPGIKFLGKEDPHAPMLTELANLGLQIKVCQNAMHHFQIQPDWLLPVAQIVPAGLLEIIDLQRKGFAYIKP